MAVALVAEAEAFVRDHGCAVVAYSGDTLLTLEQGPLTEQFVRYHEPLPLVVTRLTDRPVQKLIILDQPDAPRPARPALAAQLGQRATLVAALPGMVEMLPPGASKGRGLQRLLELLGLDPGQLLAHWRRRKRRGDAAVGPRGRGHGQCHAPGAGGGGLRDRQQQ